MVEKTETNMNKTVQILLVVTGVGLLIWFISKMQTKQGQTVVVPTATTGTAGLVDQFYGAFNRIRTPSVGVQYDSTGEKIKAISGAVSQLPSIFRGLSDFFKTSPSTVKATTPVGSSYEDYYGVGGWDA